MNYSYPSEADMGATQKRTISLPIEQADFIDSLVAGGGYASASEVVRDGLRALRVREAAMSDWLAREALPIYDRMLDDPSSGIPADQVFDEIRALHAARIRADG